MNLTPIQRDVLTALVIAVVAILVLPGLAIVALVALIVLVACWISLAVSRRGRSARREPVARALHGRPTRRGR